MNKNKCTQDHEYGPFIKSKNKFYRICNNCKKKQTYPITDEIENEYQNQILTRKIIELIIHQKIQKIPNNDFFFKLISCLCDNTSYIYINSEERKKLIIKLQELNIYYNSQIKERFKIIDNYINYLIKIKTNNKNTNEKELYKQDELYYNIQNEFNKEINNINEREEYNTIKINNDKEIESDNNLELQNLEENV